jgi:Holliday junction DNA helicase RuvB
MDERIISSEADQSEISLEQSLRPQTLKQYIGQDQVKKSLEIFIEAARLRKETLDHVLLYLDVT